MSQTDEEYLEIVEYLDGVWEHLAIWKKKDILEQAGFLLAISAKQEEYLDAVKALSPRI